MLYVQHVSNNPKDNGNDERCRHNAFGKWEESNLTACLFGDECRYKPEVYEYSCNIKGDDVHCMFGSHECNV